MQPPYRARPKSGLGDSCGRNVMEVKIVFRGLSQPRHAPGQPAYRPSRPPHSPRSGDNRHARGERRWRCQSRDGPEHHCVPARRSGHRHGPGATIFHDLPGTAETPGDCTEDGRAHRTSHRSPTAAPLAKSSPVEGSGPGDRRRASCAILPAGWRRRLHAFARPGPRRLCQVRSGTSSRRPKTCRGRLR